MGSRPPSRAAEPETTATRVSPSRRPPSTRHSWAAGHCWPRFASTLASSRVVTLVGPGGVGKTRVALRLAEMERRSYREGCWVVRLAEVPEPELLRPAVAEALGLQAADRPWDVETLADYIAHRTALLVLDNCEHLVSAVGDLVKGLRATCPNVRFLLTSRRPLRLSGEDVIVVPPLSVPDEVTVAAPEAIAHYEAVNLFVDRATSARADFRVTPDNAAAVAGLCRDLEGMPLAIELAAARVRAMSPEEIRDSLAERLRVLNLGYRDSDERHQSLRACVEWSYQLCSEIEQKFWARSSVFTGGYDLKAAAAVCVADDLPAGEILDLVSGLVDQSIVIAEDAGTGQHAVPDAHRHPAVRPGAGREGRRAPRNAGAARNLVRGAGLPVRHRGRRAAPAGLASAAPPGGRESAGRPRLLRRVSRGCRGRPGHGEEARPVLVRLRAARRGPPLAGARPRHGSGDAAGASPRDGRGRPLRGAPARPEPGPGNWSTRGPSVATTVEDTQALGLLLVPAAMLAVWDGTPTAAADQADSAVALLRAASNLPGELMALFVAGVCHGFAGNSVEAAARHRAVHRPRGRGRRAPHEGAGGGRAG